MKNILGFEIVVFAAAVLAAVFAASCGRAQEPIRAAQVIAHDLEITTSPLPTAAAPSTSVVGPQGTVTYYYWVVARYQQGNAAPSSAGAAYDAPQTLSGSNYVTVTWNTVPGALSYDLLRTLSPSLPASGSGTIAVSTALAGTFYNDQGAALSTYTINTWPANFVSMDFNANGVIGFKDFGGQVFNVKSFGAAGNTVERTDGSIASTSSTLTSASANFTAADQGKYVVVFGAGASGAPLLTSIAAILSSTSVTLAAAASTTVSGANFTYGSSDLAAATAALSAAGAEGGGIVYFPPGGYLLGSLEIPSNAAIECASPGSTTLFSPALGNYGIIDSTGHSNVGLFRCTVDGQQVGSAASGYLVAFRDVTNGWIEGNYIHDAGASDVGVDINAPSAPSSHIFIDHNLIAYSHSTVIATVQAADGATDLHFDHNTLLENLSGQLMFGGDGLQNSELDNNSFFGTSAVSACIQIEASATNVVNVGVHGNFCSGVGGSQSAILFTESGSNSISNIHSSGNTIVNCGRGESVNNFNGSGSGTVKDIAISDEQIIGTSSGAGVYIWNHAGGTFQNIRISDVQIDGCGSGDGAGCIVLSQSMTGVSLNGIQVLGVPSGETGLYETGSVGTVAIGSFSSSGGNGPFSATTNLLGNIIASGVPSGSCVTGATYQNTSGASGTTSYACVAGAWADVK